MAEKIGLDIDIKAPGGSKTVSEIRKEIKELTNQTAGLTAGTKEYAAAIAEIGEKKAALKDLKEDIMALDPDEKAKAFVALGTTIAGGFAAASGAAALFGASNEDIEKQLLKVQSATAILAGVQSVADAREELGRIRIIALRAKETLATNLQAGAESKNAIVKGASTAAQYLLNSAMLANPIFLVIAGVTALILAYKAFSDSATEAEIKQKVLNETLADAKKLDEAASVAFSKVAADRDALYTRAIALSKAKGATDKEIHALEMQQIKERITFLAREQGFASDGKLSDEKQKQLLDAKNQLAVKDADFKSKEKEAEDKHNKDLLDKQKTFLEKKKAAKEKADQDELSAKKLIQDLKAKDAEDEFRERENIARLEAQRKIDEIEAGRATEATKKEAEALIAEDLKIQLAKIGNDEFNAAVAAEQAKSDATNAIGFEDLQKKKDKRLKDLEDQKAMAEASFAIAQSSVDGISALGDLLISNSEANAKFQKGAAIAQVAVDTARGISSAIVGATAAAKDTGPLAPFTLVAYITSGIASVLGGMAKATKLLGSSPSVSKPSLAAPSRVSAPSIGNAINGAAQNAPELFKGNAGTITGSKDGENLFQPIIIQNNISESDITKTQRNINRLQERARIK